MAEYHWNEPPNDFLALLDTSSSLPPLTGFDTNAATLPDFFGLDQATVDPLLSEEIPTTDLNSPPSILHVPNFVTSPVTGATTFNPPSEHGSEHDNSGVPPLPSTPDISTETMPGTSNSLSSAASDVTAGASAVDMARKAAEDFANGKVSERKRRMGRHDDVDDDDAKRRKGNDGSLCSEGDDDAPEKVSHRKYQKRLQKNRDSAYVSRIRRREYTKRLEDGLNRMEKEKLEIQSKYDTLQRKFDVVLQELKTMKEATAAKFKAIARPVGAAGRTATKTKGAGAIVTTMFMCALIFGFMVPDSLTKTSAWRTDLTNPLRLEMGNGGESKNFRFVKDRQKEKGRVWRGMEPVAPPSHWGWNCNDDGVIGNIARNVSMVFGPENGGEMVRLLKSRVQKGAVNRESLDEVNKRSNALVENMNTETEKQNLSSGRSKLLKVVLKKLASVADECFTKELIALLTIRLLPNEGMAKLKK